MLIGAIGFVIAGIWLLYDSERFVNTTFSSIVVIKIAGGLGIAFFGTIAFSIISKLFSKNWGITIDKTGIHNNSSGVSAGLIKWEDIISYTIEGVASESFLFIFVKNPEFYIARKKNMISKMAMKAN